MDRSVVSGKYLIFITPVYKYKLTFYSSKSFFSFLLYTERKTNTYHLLHTYLCSMNTILFFSYQSISTQNLI
jgi:hypothetical protein